MGQVSRIHRSRQPHRPHYVEEWAVTRGYATQAELVRALPGVDKSTVSRWYRGATPSAESQEQLAALFDCAPEELFRHPDERWLAQFFTGRSREEIEHIKRAAEVTWPRKAG